MSSSWRDGMAFCALIHRYRPDIINLDKLNPKDYKGNLALAFRLAEHELGIPALLDVEDLLNTYQPDRLSLLTYLSQFYHRLNQSDSGISSLSNSPASSDNEAEAGSSLTGGRCLRRSNSSGRRRGAIHSLMDGRRVRSLSCGARRRIPSESNPSPPVESENPFRSPSTPENRPKVLTQVKESTISEVQKVKLREKKV